MAMVMAQADAKAGRSIRGAPKFAFFDFPDDPQLPHATLNGHTGTSVNKTHFHIRDQFQLAIAGNFSIGRHQLSPYSVHFSRAYTPYGPLLAKDGGDYTFFVMRAHRDTGAHYITEELEQLRAVPDRRPWQISRHIAFPAPQIRSALPDVMLEAVPDVKDEHGLAAHTLIMKPHTSAMAPDPTRGGGQYLVIVSGSLWHDSRERKATALVFVKPDEEAYEVKAGAEGLEAIILDFPRASGDEVNGKA